MTKVLYISNAHGADYQCDMLFHGLRSLLGADCVDVNHIHFMYQGTPNPPFFSIYGLLPNMEVDRSDISTKIKNRYFDAIVYGSIQRCQTFLEEVTTSYPPSRVAFIDGEDDHTVRRDMKGRGLYFKRELPDGEPWILPIGFCIPKEKIVVSVEKTCVLAPLDPADRSTYVYYGSEASYYEQYSTSYFAKTMKKGGWDCCRHYEIMAAGCIPLFENLEGCPERTLHFLPKNNLYHSWVHYKSWTGMPSLQQQDLWVELMDIIREKLLNHLTTEAMAKYMLERISQ